MDLETTKKIGYLERMVGNHVVLLQEMEKSYASIIGRLTTVESRLQALIDAKTQRPQTEDPV